MDVGKAKMNCETGKAGGAGGRGDRRKEIGEEDRNGGEASSRALQYGLR